MTLTNSFPLKNISAIEKSAKEHNIQLRHMDIKIYHGDGNWFTLEYYDLNGEYCWKHETGPNNRDLFWTLDNIFQKEDKKIFQNKGNYIIPKIMLPISYDSERIYNWIKSHNEKLQLYEESN